MLGLKNTRPSGMGEAHRRSFVVTDSLSETRIKNLILDVDFSGKI